VRAYFALVGLACWAGAIILAARRVSVAVSGVRATGRIVAFETREDDGSVCYLPVVTFTDQEGRSHRFTSVAGRAQPKPPVHSEVVVRYLPGRPSAVFIESFLHMWAAPVALAILGAGALLAVIRP
jgi:hypothetical protein